MKDDIVAHQNNSIHTEDTEREREMVSNIRIRDYVENYRALLAVGRVDFPDFAGQSIFIYQQYFDVRIINMYSELKLTCFSKQSKKAHGDILRDGIEPCRYQQPESERVNE